MKRKIKVMYVIGSMETGGTERHLLEVIRNLDRSRFEPVLCCISSGGALEPQFRATGIEIGVFGFRGIQKRPRLLWELLAIFWFMIKHRPAVVHAYLYWANVVGGLFGWLTFRPVIITSRRGLGMFKDADLRFQKMENLINRVTDVITVNSLGVKADVLAREKLDPEKVRLIYNGVPARFSVEAQGPGDHLRSQLGIRNDAVVIGCVANVHRYKGYADLIEAFSAVHRKFPHTQLVCVGKDRGIVSELHQLAAELDCSDSVVFTGDRSDIESILPQFHIQVLASHEEGFSNAVLEGMAAGNPMVVTDVGGNAEAVLDGIHGYVVPPRAPEALAKALLHLIEAPEKAREMGRLGRERVKEVFTIEAMVHALEQLYLEQVRLKTPGRLLSQS